MHKGIKLPWDARYAHTLHEDGKNTGTLATLAAL
jgi:hypothetical protein